MSLPFAGLIFDCDGTLADTMPAHYVAWRATMNKYGIEFPEDRFYALGGVPTERIIEILSHEQGVTVDVAAVGAEKEEAYLQYISDIRPVEHVVSIARSFHKRVPLGVATGSPHWLALKTLTQIGVLPLFDGLAAADHVTKFKPEPDVFLEAARQIGVAPSQCWAFEDTDIGMEAIRRAGMVAIDVRHMAAGRPTPWSELRL